MVYNEKKNSACTDNPYKDAVNKSFNDILMEAKQWFDYGRYDDQLLAIHSNYSLHDHKRFFPFTPMAQCTDIQCVGGECSDDDSKIICGIKQLSALDDCVIYSIGGNNEWQFEEDVSAKGFSIYAALLYIM